MVDAILGTRVRLKRRERGVTQAALARQVGISASYLNLIEWNKRRIGKALLVKISTALGVNLEDLAGAEEHRLHAQLTEVAHLPALRPAAPETERVNELIGRFPGWAKGIAALAHLERQASTRAQVLSDQLSNDLFLGEALHHMLTRIAAIRSAAEIVVDYPDLDTDERTRFDGIIHEETRTLSDLGQSLAAYLDQAEQTERTVTPLDEVEALFQANDHQFDALETATAHLVHKVALNDDTAPPGARLHHATTLLDQYLGDTIEAIIETAPLVPSKAGRRRARRKLRDYAVAALLMPLGPFREEARALSYDVEGLANAFGVGIDQVCQRLTALPKEDQAPVFGYVTANAAGTIVDMSGLSGLLIPRYTTTCPLWVLHRAQQSPETVMRQLAVFPSGERFVFVARARNMGPTGFGKPRHYLTDMLTLTEAHAAMTVYAPEKTAPHEDVGSSCRLCPRRECPHRVEDELQD